MQDVNDIFAEFAECFVGKVRGKSDIVLSTHLHRALLDYSVESLKSVDAYLQRLHGTAPQQLDDQWISAVLWGGSYVGEVIRRHAPRRYDWIDFDEFVKGYPDTTKLLGSRKQLGACALLTSGGGSFTLPINKILRFIYDGPADSVWFYADCEVQPK